MGIDIITKMISIQLEELITEIFIGERQITINRVNNIDLHIIRLLARDCRTPYSIASGASCRTPHSFCSGNNTKCCKGKDQQNDFQMHTYEKECFLMLKNIDKT